MTADFAKPQRSIKSEIFALLAVSLVPIGIISVFPYKSVGHTFKSNEREARAFASFVFLTEAEEAEAIERARNTWQAVDTSQKGTEIDLSLENLPELDNASVLDSPVIHVRTRVDLPVSMQMEFSIPSLEAPDHPKVDSSPIEQRKYFLDEDLMQLK